MARIPVKQRLGLYTLCDGSRGPRRINSAHVSNSGEHRNDAAVRIMRIYNTGEVIVDVCYQKGGKQ